MKKNAIGIYIHIPFCVKKCLYCDFNSYPGMLSHAEDYVTAAVGEIELRRLQAEGRRVVSVYIGGGTPTIIGADLIKHLLSAVRRNFDVLPAAEFTIEANPGTVSVRDMDELRKAGINRLSIGLQAWQDKLLKSLGRIHGREDFIKAYTAAQDSGFDNINIDVMFGLPGQAVQDWDETLERVIELGPEHISTYSLEIERGTRFFELKQAGQLSLPDELMERGMYDRALAILTKSGYAHYEISNFARPGRECRHNLLYWKGAGYLGIGAGAHSYLSGARFANHADPGRYIKAVDSGVLPTAQFHVQSRADEMSDYMFMGLRLVQGVSRKAFAKRFGKTVEEVYGNAIERLRELGLIEDTGARLRLSRRGLDLANLVFEEFIL